MAFDIPGGLSPVSISIEIKGVFPMSEESFENISLYSSHSSSTPFYIGPRTSASCSLTFLYVSTSAGEVMNTFSENISQFGFMGSMFLLCNMVSVLISSTVMSSFSKCPSISPFPQEDSFFRQIKNKWYALSFSYFIVMYCRNED